MAILKLLSFSKKNYKCIIYLSDSDEPSFVAYGKFTNLKEFSAINYKQIPIHELAMSIVKFKILVYVVDKFVVLLLNGVTTNEDR